MPVVSVSHEGTMSILDTVPNWNLFSLRPKRDYPVMVFLLMGGWQPMAGKISGWMLGKVGNQ
ncbi:MAG: hypothetical protein CSB48_01915 [Proteobacteria bacterium]|nr:MAG: hypothetical protein CSB48_01915 [Pseudomonadota bacterium]PIE40383.1 MAG: hypothetical protein CSA51_00875 [Gammaproteobacteria bacterium]